ncbi:hypothetical protein ES332_A09G037200v1 [Gossypium tomentosum]|uniref:Uncharacterized protein n=1 Tax=Gossypium tomentosum TaxID=34277 RepID=A0A5D2P0Q8_GOSTO|nr:hypothetical protein ES332_A09G037200v1 [Gossypium tomentosum]
MPPSWASGQRCAKGAFPAPRRSTEMVVREAWRRCLEERRARWLGVGLACGG